MKLLKNGHLAQDSFWSTFESFNEEDLVLITPTVNWRWRELRRAVHARISTYQRIGIGGVVVLYGHNQLELALHVLALSRCGITFICIPRSVSLKTMQDWVRGCNAQWCLSELEVLPPLLRNLKFCSTTWAQDELLYRSREDLSDEREKPGISQEKLMMIIGGSGSTGHSKLIGVTHAQMLERLQMTSKALGLCPADHSMWWVHVEYASAIHRFLAGLYSGGVYLLFDGPMTEALKWATGQKVSVMSGAVIHAEMLLALKPDKTLLSGLRLLTVAGSVINEGLRERIRQELTQHLTLVYGTNECWYATLLDTNRIGCAKNSIGWPVAGAEVQVIKAGGTPASNGEVGYLEVRSRAVSEAYLEVNGDRAIKNSEGWFRTGDLASALPSGELIFCGRSDLLMIYNGINIYPIEIEECLLSHPDVLEAMVIPLRHAIHQDIPCAVVVLKKNALATTQELHLFAAERLGVKQPQRMVLVDHIPRNHQSKPDKEKLNAILRSKWSPDPQARAAR
jgi:acyl-coenzyme A synthetase/AMP-(fatty) acid ligase